MSNYIERMVTEATQLQTKLYSLDVFLANPKPDSVFTEEWDLLKEQQFHMAEYNRVLEKRIELAKSKEGDNVVQ